MRLIRQTTWAHPTPWSESGTPNVAAHAEIGQRKIKMIGRYSVNGPPIELHPVFETQTMKIWVGITDEDWFDRLSALRPDEVNFWQPSGSRIFRALQPGEPFLFKLHSPKNSIVGGGHFVRFQRFRHRSPGMHLAKRMALRR
jgi:hypothetical protein